MNRSRKEKLKEALESLEPEEHAQVFEVIKRYTNDYTRTQTGVFISSESLSDACLLELESLVLYYTDQRKRMDAETAERKALRGTAKNG